MTKIYLRHRFGLGWILGRDKLFVQLSTEIQHALGYEMFLIFNKIAAQSTHPPCGARATLDLQGANRVMETVQGVTKEKDEDQVGASEPRGSWSQILREGGMSHGQPRQARPRGEEAEKEQTGPWEITVPTRSDETSSPECAAGTCDSEHAASD